MTLDTGGTHGRDPVMYMLGQIDSKLDALTAERKADMAQGLADHLKLDLKIEEHHKRLTSLEHLHMRLVGVSLAVGALLAYVGHDRIAMLFVAVAPSVPHP